MFNLRSVHNFLLHFNSKFVSSLEVLNLDLRQILQMDHHLRVLLVPILQDLPGKLVLLIELLLGLIHKLFQFLHLLGVLGGSDPVLGSIQI